MSAVTVITSGKGGVGKTTVCAGFGAALARRGNRVLLIDADAGLRGLDRMTGIDTHLVFDVSDIIAGNCAPMQAIYACPSTSNLFVLPAPARVQDAVSIKNMYTLISILRPYYDHILIDCPAGLGEDFHASVSVADSAIVVVNADPMGLRNGSYVSSLLHANHIDSQRLIINRFDVNFFEATGCYKDLDEVIDIAEIQLLAVIPNDYSLAKAAAKGQLCPPGLPGTMAFDRMAARFEGEFVPISLT